MNHPRLRVNSTSSGWCPHKKKGRLKEAQEEEGDGKTYVEIGTMLSHAIESQEPPDTGRCKEGFLPRAPGGSVALRTRWF